MAEGFFPLFKISSVYVCVHVYLWVLLEDKFLKVKLLGQRVSTFKILLGRQGKLPSKMVVPPTFWKYRQAHIITNNGYCQ